MKTTLPFFSGAIVGVDGRVIDCEQEGSKATKQHRRRSLTLEPSDARSSRKLGEHVMKTAYNCLLTIRFASILHSSELGDSRTVTIFIQKVTFRRSRDSNEVPLFTVEERQQNRR